MVFKFEDQFEMVFSHVFILEDKKGEIKMINGDEELMLKGGPRSNKIEINYNKGMAPKMHNGSINEIKGATKYYPGRGEEEEFTILMFTASDDRTIKIFTLVRDELKEIGVFKSHKGPVTSISYSQETNTLISGSRDKTVIIWREPVEKPKSRRESFMNQLGSEMNRKARYDD